jgi:hypothetical protein
VARRPTIDIEQANYIRGLTERGLEEFQLRLLQRWQDARRRFKDATEDLNKQRDVLTFIARVKAERAVSNLVEFRQPQVEEQVVTKRRKRRA